jgi:hypothetical protein
MELPFRQPCPEGYRVRPSRPDNRQDVPPHLPGCGGLIRMIGWVLCALLAAPVCAEPLRIATWAGDFSRDGPGLMLQEFRRNPEDAALSPILEAHPDILLLTDFDYDAGAATLSAFRDLLTARGLDYPHLFAARPNTGMPTDRDLDGDGRLGGPRDAQGYGPFAGYGGQAMLSRYPLSLIENHSAMLWKDTFDSRIASDDPGHTIQRLASTAFWRVEADTPNGPLTLLTLAATPPVFDGPEDRNGRRNHDEVLFWHHRLDQMPPDKPLILIGNFNLDPDRGDGLRSAVQTLLTHTRLQDPLPGTATVDWQSTGPMRVSYVLPDAALTVTGAGTTGPHENGGPHALVWIEID